jgi:hypothetical protein
VKQFLNAKSMLTPGIAGAVAMLITNSLTQQFELPGKWVALLLSFLLGTLVFIDKNSSVWQRGVLYLLNSLIIFSMAVGTNSAGRATAAPRRLTVQQFTDNGPTQPSGFFREWFGE